MTPQRAKELLPIIQAYAEGKTIEVTSINGKTWQADNDILFTRSPEFYRVKPEPVRVPWTASDVPPLCWVSRPGYEGRFLVINVYSDGLETHYHFGHSKLLWTTLARHYEHSTDLKTWHPCNREVQS